MERDIDKKLYNNYLNGEKQAFEFLYNKYKNRIEYFVFNIVKDYQKAEDIAQETFIYVMQNEMNKNISFKYYIYLVAKSKAYNYINVEKRRKEIKSVISRFARSRIVQERNMALRFSSSILSVS